MVSRKKLSTLATANPYASLDNDEQHDLDSGIPEVHQDTKTMNIAAGEDNSLQNSSTEYIGTGEWQYMAFKKAKKGTKKGNKVPGETNTDFQPEEPHSKPSAGSSNDNANGTDLDISEITGYTVQGDPEYPDTKTEMLVNDTKQDGCFVDNDGDADKGQEHAAAHFSATFHTTEQTVPAEISSEQVPNTDSAVFTTETQTSTMHTPVVVEEPVQQVQSTKQVSFVPTLSIKVYDANITSEEDTNVGLSEQISGCNDLSSPSASGEDATDESMDSSSTLNEPKKKSKKTKKTKANNNGRKENNKKRQTQKDGTMCVVERIHISKTELIALNLGVFFIVIIIMVLLKILKN